METPVQSLVTRPRSRTGKGHDPASRRATPIDETGGLSRETLGDRVTETLRSLLMAGRLAPGDKLSLRSVAQSLDVSMMPVREAVTRLAADGALEVLPGRAIRVPILTVAQFEELTRVRLAVEGFAAEEAARNRSEDDLVPLERYERAFQDAADREPPDASEAVVANHDLHFAVYRAAGMPTLIEIIGRLWLKAGPVLNLDMRDEARRLRGGRAVQAHAALVSAIRARDPKAAREALETDIRTAARHIVGIGRLGAP